MEDRERIHEEWVTFHKADLEKLKGLLPEDPETFHSDHQMGQVRIWQSTI